MPRELLARIRAVLRRREMRRTGEQEPVTRALVALRPPTESWPRPAQMGLDWALTHALDDVENAEPVRWSSTGVKDRFVIRVDRSAGAADAGGHASCLRYEIERADDAKHRRYPGLACKSEKSGWAIPSPSPVQIAQPLTDLSRASAATSSVSNPMR